MIIIVISVSHHKLNILMEMTFSRWWVPGLISCAGWWTLSFIYLTTTPECCHPTILSNYGLHCFSSVPLCLYAAAPLISLKPFKGTRLASTATRSWALKTRKGGTALESKRRLWGPGWLGALPVRSRGSLCRWQDRRKVQVTLFAGGDEEWECSELLQCSSKARLQKPRSIYEQVEGWEPGINSNHVCSGKIWRTFRGHTSLLPQGKLDLI